MTYRRFDSVDFYIPEGRRWKVNGEKAILISELRIILEDIVSRSRNKKTARRFVDKLKRRLKRR